MGPYVTPTLGDTRVYWGSPYPRGNVGADGHFSDFGLAIYGRTLDGTGPLEVVADNAILPAADGDCVYFARVHGSDPGVPEGRVAVGRRCGTADEEPVFTSTVGPRGAISRLAADEGRVAWAIHDLDGAGATVASAIEVLDTSTHEVVVIDTGLQAVGELSLDGDHMTWTSPNGSRFLANLAANEVWLLPGAEGYTPVYLASSRVGWRYAAEDGRVRFGFGRLESST